MATFNVLNAPWIFVEDNQGQRKELGILDVLRNCQNYRRLYDTSPILEYGVYRFLIVFLMDALRPETSDKLRDLYRRGSIDMNTIQKYVDVCKAEGCSFDLFDKKRPFLQAPYDPALDTKKNIKAVCHLLKDIPSGNNVVHFDHKQEDDRTLSYAECARALTSITVFSTAGLDGPSSVNGAPPVFEAVDGKNLYVSLVLGMVPFSLSTISIDSPPVAWRNKQVIHPNEKCPLTSLFFGMTFPCRRISLIDEGLDGCIAHMYYQYGLQFTGFDSWIDPHVAYVYDDNGKKHSIKPQKDKEVWREISNIFVCNKSSASIVRNLVDFYEDIGQQPILKTYSVVTNQGAYVYWQKNILSLPITIVRDSEKMSVVSYFIGRMELLASKTLDVSIRSIEDGEEKKPQKTKSKKEKYGDLGYSAMTQFYAQCKIGFYSFCQRLIATTDDFDSLIGEWEAFLINEARSCFDIVEKGLGNSSKNIMRIAQEKTSFEKKLATWKKKGGR